MVILTGQLYFEPLAKRKHLVPGNLTLRIQYNYVCQGNAETFSLTVPSIYVLQCISGFLDWLLFLFEVVIVAADT